MFVKMENGAEKKGRARRIRYTNQGEPVALENRPGEESTKVFQPEGGCYYLAVAYQG